MSLRVAEYEVAETHVFLEYVTQVDARRLGILIHELKALSQRPLAVLALRTLYYQRHILVNRADVTQQFQSGIRVFLAPDRESHVAYHAECACRILVVYLHCLLVCAGEHHLWTSSHAQCRGMTVERLGGETLALHEHIAVKIRQNRTVIAYAVLHKKNHLHPTLAYVVVEIHLVLDEFYYRENEVCVAEPAEHIVENGEILILHAPCDAV